MALLDIFKKKRKDITRRPTPKVELPADVEAAADEKRPSIAAPTSGVLRSFHVSEKATRGMALNQYTFMVGPEVTKTQVRDAVERSYKVNVVDVQTVHLPSKNRMFGRHMGRVPARKKAIVTIKDGQTIAAAQQ
ncbi:MAG TPA: 50S ribosomal protein L23 [Candidatus Paceibacterota bacterium]|nr:50S ribosomal protein L23 [Candidatus Paceibacterota bacterium]